MKSIAEWNKSGEPSLIGKYFHYDWIFSSPLEKIIIVVVFGYAFYNLLKLVGGLF